MVFLGRSLAILMLLGLAAAAAQDARPAIEVRPLSRAPVLEDFLDMQPPADLAAEMARVTGFIQREPSDGRAAQQATDVYLGYDHSNFYAVFVAWDTEPEKIRGRLSRREDVFGDDHVHLMLDTFHDQRRAYSFIANPLGVQWDALWTEGTRTRLGSVDQGSFDSSFDTVWHSRGRVTQRGYVVWMAIPFRSLRFTAAGRQTWGIILNRAVTRMDENAFWPRVSSRIEGRLNQAARLEGLEGISPGRNIQLQPYAVFRSFRALDLRDPVAPEFAARRAEADAGLDAKLVLRDSFVLDLTGNPDFSQVESDDPQVTVNQRFEVFFPEKRPFFLENANYFATPIQLLFTRRIADPQFGIRLTGKSGPWAVGALYADDQAPGRRVLAPDPLAGTRAHFGVVRVSRDILHQSHLAGMFTVREFEGSHNRVGGADGRLRMNHNWSLAWQAAHSHTLTLGGAELSGPAFLVDLRHSSRQLTFNTEYRDIAPGFRTLPGFVPRTDIRQPSANVLYQFRPEGRYVIAYGPSLSVSSVWDHAGTRLDWRANPNFAVEFRGRTSAGVFAVRRQERLRPQDHFLLAASRDYATAERGFYFNTQRLQQVSLSSEYFWGTRVNFVPAAGEPEVAAVRGVFLSLGVRPNKALRNDNTYILNQFRLSGGSARIFTNHIARSRWNWQISRELSVRAIVEYNALLADPSFTFLETTRNLNFDFLVTYLLHPGTALHVGYNSNLQNLHPGLCQRIPGSRQCDPPGSGLVRTPSGLINDGRQFFVKMSYLYRF